MLRKCRDRGSERQKEVSQKESHIQSQKNDLRATSSRCVQVQWCRAESASQLPGFESHQAHIAVTQHDLLLWFTSHSSARVRAPMAHHSRRYHFSRFIYFYCTKIPRTHNRNKVTPLYSRKIFFDMHASMSRCLLRWCMFCLPS